MNAQLPLRCLLTVEAEDDPQVPCRVLGLFTQRGCLPDWFSVRRTGVDGVRIVVEMPGLDDQAGELFVRKLRNIPTVLDVSRTWLRWRASVTA